MTNTQQYKEELIRELYELSININEDEIIEAYEEAVSELNLDVSNYEELITYLSSPKEFINYYANEKLGIADKQVGKQTELTSKFQIRIKQILNMPVTYIDNNSLSRFLVLLAPAVIVFFTLLFGNYIDYNESDEMYYQSLSLVFLFPMYELFILFTRTHLTSYFHAVILRNIYRGILLVGLLIYLVNPFDYKGSLTEYLDEFPEKEGSVGISGSFDYILGIWFIALISFELIILLQLITTKSQSTVTNFKGIPIKIFIYEMVVFTGMLFAILFEDNSSIINWILLIAFFIIIYFRVSKHLNLFNFEHSGLIAPLLFFVFVMFSYVNKVENDFITIFEMRFFLPFFFVGLFSSVKEIADETIIKQSKYNSANELIVQSQLFVSSNQILGKIKIYYVFLIFLIIEIYDEVSGKSEGRNVNASLGALILIVVTFVLIELDKLKIGIFSSIMITLDKNKFLVLYFLISTWMVFNNFANFYEGANLSNHNDGNNGFKIIDYQLVYLNLLLYGMLFGVILVILQNSAIHQSKKTMNSTNWKSLNIVIILLVVEFVYIMHYLLAFAFSGVDGSYFRESETELYLGLFLFLGIQFLLPLLNTINMIKNEPRTVLYATA